MPIKPITQLTLFPTADNLEEVMQKGIAMLPIKNQNELVALLHLNQNTVLNLMKSKQENV